MSRALHHVDRLATPTGRRLRITREPVDLATALRIIAADRRRNPKAAWSLPIHPVD